MKYEAVQRRIVGTDERGPAKLFFIANTTDAKDIAAELNRLAEERDALLAACKGLMDEAALANELVELLGKASTIPIGEMFRVFRYNALVEKRESHRAAIAKAEGGAK